MIQSLHRMLYLINLYCIHVRVQHIHCRSRQIREHWIRSNTASAPMQLMCGKNVDQTFFQGTNLMQSTIVGRFAIELTRTGGLPRTTSKCSFWKAVNLWVRNLLHDLEMVTFSICVSQSLLTCGLGTFPLLVFVFECLQG